jgi:hypothetical protein
MNKSQVFFNNNDKDKREMRNFCFILPLCTTTDCDGGGGDAGGGGFRNRRKRRIITYDYY